MKKKSAYRKLNPSILSAQFGDKTTWRFTSITTPNYGFTFTRVIAEFVMLQRHGFRALPPYFWYKKTGRPELRKEFKDIENQIAAMVYRSDGTITAQQLLSILCEKFSPEPLPTPVSVDMKEDAILSEQPLITLRPQQNSKETRRSMIKRLGD